MATMTKTATRVTAPKPFNLPSRRAEGGSGPELHSAALRDGALLPFGQRAPPPPPRGTPS